MYIKKDSLIEAYKVEYEHYFKKYSLIKIIFKTIKDHLSYFKYSSNTLKKLEIMNFTYAILYLNKNIHNQMHESINQIFDQNKTCFINFKTNKIKNFINYELSDFIILTKKEIYCNLIYCSLNIIKFILRKISKEELFYNINKLFYKSFYLLENRVSINKNIKIINFDDADSKVRILNQSLFKDNQKISIQQGLIINNSIEYLYPSSDVFLVYGDYFKEKLLNYFNFKKEIVSLGVFELISDSIDENYMNKYKNVYISQPYVKSLFKNYFDKISFDMKISAIFKDQKIIKKFHPFEKKFTKILNLILCRNFKFIDKPIIEIIKQSDNLITLSSTAAFFGILFKKNIIVIKHKYSNYFEEFIESKFLKYSKQDNYNMIFSADNLAIDYFFSGNLVNQKYNFDKYFNG